MCGVKMAYGWRNGIAAAMRRRRPAVACGLQSGGGWLRKAANQQCGKAWRQQCGNGWPACVAWHSPV